MQNKLKFFDSYDYKRYNCKIQFCKQPADHLISKLMKVAPQNMNLVSLGSFISKYSTQTVYHIYDSNGTGVFWQAVFRSMTSKWTCTCARFGCFVLTKQPKTDHLFGAKIPNYLACISSYIKSFSIWPDMPMQIKN